MLMEGWYTVIKQFIYTKLISEKLKYPAPHCHREEFNR